MSLKNLGISFYVLENNYSRATTKKVQITETYLEISSHVMKIA